MAVAIRVPFLGTRIKGAPLGWVTAGLFLACFAPVIVGLVRAWISLPDAAHGILIAPVAVWLAWRSGPVADLRPARWAGSALILVAVFANLFGRVAGVETIPRAAFLLALVGLTLWFAGWRQILAWWLPFLLMAPGAVWIPRPCPSYN